jgi:type I restriction enzyme M protein
MNLADILKDSNYKLSQFTTAEIEQLEQSITLKATKSGEVPYIVCLVRQKAIKLTPEEAIRQLYLQVLNKRLHYPLNRIQVEYGVNFGREVKRADIVVMDKDRPNTVYMNEVTEQEEWDNIYNAGFKRLKRLRPKGNKDFREFQFDVLMANPPFAGDIKEPRMIALYDLAKKADGKW